MAHLSVNNQRARVAIRIFQVAIRRDALATKGKSLPRCGTFQARAYILKARSSGHASQRPANFSSPSDRPDKLTNPCTEPRVWIESMPS